MRLTSCRLPSLGSHVRFACNRRPISVRLCAQASNARWPWHSALTALRDAEFWPLLCRCHTRGSQARGHSPPPNGKRRGVGLVCLESGDVSFGLPRHADCLCYSAGDELLVCAKHQGESDCPVWQIETRCRSSSPSCTGALQVPSERCFVGQCHDSFASNGAHELPS